VPKSNFLVYHKECGSGQARLAASRQTLALLCHSC
jgi:hypothetical protein